MDEINFSERFLRSYGKGEVIFEENSVGRHMYAINSGTVSIVKKIQGEGVLLATLGKGEIFGEMALVDNLPRSASAVAAEENTSVLEIDHSHFIYLVGQQPAFALIVLRALSLKLRKQTEADTARRAGE